MRRPVFVVVIGAVGLAAAAAAVWDHRAHHAAQPKAIGFVDPSTVRMKPAPINPAWILEGNPEAQSGEVARTADGSTQVLIWSATAGRFNWFYDFDETVTILDGEVFISDRGGPERRFGPGDSIVFPVGAHTTWRVPSYVRKLATFKPPLPSPVASALRWVKSAKGWIRRETTEASLADRTL